MKNISKIICSIAPFAAAAAANSMMSNEEIIKFWRDGESTISASEPTSKKAPSNPAGNIEIISRNYLSVEETGTMAPCSFAPCSFAPCTFVPCNG